MIHGKEWHWADKRLMEKLKAELPGSLNWALTGCLAWQREVLKATAEYREEMDPIAEFLRECCVLNPQAVILAASLYEAYVQWAAERQELPRSQWAFSRSLTERGIGQQRSSQRAGC